MSEKETLLAEAEQEFRSLVSAIAGLGEPQMREVWCGAWSLREILGHISGWHREMAPALERLRRGERPIPEGVSYADPDAWNARFGEVASARSTADLLTELEASHADFMRAAAGVPADRFGPGKTAYRIVDLNSRHHYQEHGTQIAAWRTSRGV